MGTLLERDAFFLGVRDTRRDDNTSRARQWEIHGDHRGRGYGVALAREAVLHPQEQSYIGSWCRDRSRGVGPRRPFPRERRSSVIT